MLRWEEKAIIEEAKAIGIEVVPFNIKSGFFDITSQENSYGDVALERATSYYKGLHMSAIVEASGTPVINSREVLEITGNKLFTLLRLKSAGIAVPKTYVSFDPDSAMSAFRALGGKAVIKPVTGSWGRLVGLLEGEYSAKAVIEDRAYMDPIYQIYYLQEYVNRPPRDIRAFVVGNDVIAAIYRYQPEGDWRTNTALGGRAENCVVNEELRETAIKAAEAIGEGIYGVDIMESDDGYLVHEVNGTVEFKHSVSVTGVNIPRKIVEYAIRRAKR